MSGFGGIWLDMGDMGGYGAERVHWFYVPHFPPYPAISPHIPSYYINIIYNGFLIYGGQQIFKIWIGHRLFNRV